MWKENGTGSVAPVLARQWYSTSMKLQPTCSLVYLSIYVSPANSVPLCHSLASIKSPCTHYSVFSLRKRDLCHKTVRFEKLLDLPNFGRYN